MSSSRRIKAPRGPLPPSPSGPSSPSGCRAAKCARARLLLRTFFDPRASRAQLLASCALIAFRFLPPCRSEHRSKQRRNNEARTGASQAPRVPAPRCGRSPLLAPLPSAPPYPLPSAMFAAPFPRLWGSAAPAVVHCECSAVAPPRQTTVPLMSHARPPPTTSPRSRRFFLQAWYCNHCCSHAQIAG